MPPVLDDSCMSPVVVVLTPKPDSQRNMAEENFGSKG